MAPHLDSDRQWFVKLNGELGIRLGFMPLSAFLHAATIAIFPDFIVTYHVTIVDDSATGIFLIVTLNDIPHQLLPFVTLA